MCQHIPQEEKRVQKSTLPWLNGTCLSAIAEKHQAEGQTNYKEVASRVQQVLSNERNKYMAKLKARMEKLPKASKQLWALNKRLLHRQHAPPLFPPLKDSKEDNSS